MDLEFEKLTLDCIETLRPFFVDNACRINDCTVGGTFLWRDFHGTGYAIEDGVLYLKVSYPEIGFAPPIGAPLGKESFNRIIEYCAGKGDPVRFCSVSEALLARILDMFPGSSVRSDRACCDYLYLSNDIAELSGRRYAGQRNHINRFTREHPLWSFERITADNIGDARAFMEENARINARDSLTYIEGNRKALEVLNNLEKYGLFGGVLYVNGEAAGISLGEIMDDTLFIHIEKADTRYHGSYQMLMNQFARCFVTGTTSYINREEDDGDDGLRTSKLSYHPVALLDKYTVEIVAE